jgi:hypothetical protein
MTELGIKGDDDSGSRTSTTSTQQQLDDEDAPQASDSNQYNEFNSEYKLLTIHRNRVEVNLFLVGTSILHPLFSRQVYNIQHRHHLKPSRGTSLHIKHLMRAR